MDPSHSSCWDSILEKVKQHVPTIDSDSPSSEDEEFPSIYQRPAGLKLPGGFELFSMEDDEQEELLKHVTLNDDDDDDDEIVEHTSSTVTQWAAQRSEADDEADARELNGAETGASVKPNVDDRRSGEGLPVLSFARLEQWDLDDVLQNLEKGEIPLRECVSVESSKTHTDCDKDRSERNVMERLVAFCDSQSSKSVSDPKHIRHYNVPNKLPERMEAELRRSQRECPTVYVDLRCPDPSIKPVRTSPDLSSESKLNAHQETPPAKKANHKAHAGSRTRDGEVTGKSMLLREIRGMKRNGNKYPNKYPDPSYSVSGNEAGRTEELPQPVESTHSHESHDRWGDKQSPLVQFEHRNPKMESPPTSLQHEQHRQILTQLNKHRPSKSVNQTQPAADWTDVLYDREASHLQSVNTLPADIGSKACVLLTVNLSCPGAVGARAHGRRQHLDPAATKADVYNTLVAWFLSLVESESRRDEDEGGDKVPFWVAGLQQLWTEDGLALHALAVARHSYKPRKRDKDVHTPFYQHVCRFLSETSLDRIARWLPQLQNTLDQRAYASPVHLPSSTLNCFISTTSDTKVIDRTFGVSPGFYWQTVETQERVFKRREIPQELHTEVSVALGCKEVLLHPLIMHYTLQLVLQSGLDVCGLRLLYPPQGFLSDAGAEPVIQRTDDTRRPVLALAVRGLHAHSVLRDITSSLDPLMLREADHVPLRSPLFLSSPPASQVHRDLCLWFAGRIPGGSALTDDRPLNGVVTSHDRVRGSLCDLNRSSSFLSATTKADVLLVVSPAVPPRCYGRLLAVCERRGFGLRGLHRLQLQSNGAAVLGLSNQQAHVFCSPNAVTLDRGQLELPSHCLMLLLRKENALHHSVSLPAAIMREFEAQKLLGCIRSRPDGVHTLEPSFCFHTVPYSSNLFPMFVKCMWAVPDPSTVILSHQKCSSNSDVEQVVILTLRGKDRSQGLSLLHRLLTEEPEGFKLLGLKWLPALTRLQAQEVSPYEVGQQLSQHSLDHLRSSPALVCALQRAEAFASLRKLLPRGYPGNLSVLMSSTPEVAFRQASLFFFEHEMIPDPSIRPVQKIPPQNCTTKDSQTLLTVCRLKATTWKRALAELVRVLQLSGLTLVGLRGMTLTPLLPAESEPSEVEDHVENFSLALCLQGENAVRRLLHVLHREDSSMSTYYGSGSDQKAIQDVRRLFPETSATRWEQILSACSDPPASVEREQNGTLAPLNQENLSPSMESGPSGGIHSAPWQTTCLLIPSHAPPLHQVPSHLDMLEQLLKSGCHLVAGRVSVLDDEQRKHIAGTLKVSSRGNERTAHLDTAPCLIMALQGKAILTRFNLILESIYKERSDLERVGEMIIYPESQKEAEQLMCFLFDGSLPKNR